MSKKVSWEARIIDFFEHAPLPVAQAILSVVQTKMRERISPVERVPNKRNRKQKEMFPEAEATQ